MNRLHQIVLILSTVLGSWLGMQAVHESGHAIGAYLTGGHVDRVVLHPLTISRTDVSENQNPLAVVWAGPIVGVAIPLLLWTMAVIARLSIAFVLRFFAGFCLLANGLYIGVGSFTGAGDCGELLRHGSAIWQLWLFGMLTVPPGLWLWNGLGSHFGLGSASGNVSRRATYASLIVCIGLLALGLVVGGR